MFEGHESDRPWTKEQRQAVARMLSRSPQLNLFETRQELVSYLRATYGPAELYRIQFQPNHDSPVFRGLVGWAFSDLPRVIGLEDVREAWRSEGLAVDVTPA
jgi:hypothetical protein